MKGFFEALEVRQNLQHFSCKLIVGPTEYNLCVSVIGLVGSQPSQLFLPHTAANTQVLWHTLDRNLYISTTFLLGVPEPHEPVRQT